MRHSFVRVRIVRKALDEVLRICLEFCSIITRYEKATEIPLGDIERIAKKYRTQSSYLFLLPLPSKLLMRLDYNGFFSKSARGTTSASVATGVTR